jgi:shikimate kinase
MNGMAAKNKGIVLIGMAGVGKSTIGRALSRRMGLGFVDLDTYIIGKEGRRLQDIIDERGEGALVGIERARMMEISLDGTVVAPGGSVVYSPGLMRYLKKKAVLVYLDDSFSNIAGRLSNAQRRGIVGLRSKPLRELYRERKPLYSRYADITVNCRGKTKAGIVAEIIQRISPLIEA